ncbi:MAG: penicillin-binding protein 2 [Micavibrio aeruginosavorus]|uniref:Penicillin-binding protein 2 n=1 Tax=Micavibrio aeruginosavorus TaxID=349221 RepID=A0A2W5A157_9BACT|nr:MAG: penicillin-binding protein 2 [Micavibrio aeruginosavorus]
MNPFNRSNINFTGQKRSALDMARGRLVFLSLFFILCYIVVAARVFDLTIIQGEMKKNEETVSYLEAEPQAQKKHQRADILDRNGVILARSLKTASLYADPLVITDPKTVAKDLSKVFPDLSYGDLLKKLQEKKRFVWIKRNITPDDQYKILYLGHPGLSFEEENRRIYPQGNLVSHIVGYTSVDGKGLSGMEAGFDKLLSKSDEPLTSTIDVRVQHALRREIAGAMKKFSGIAGAGAVMDINTGEMLAAVSLPDFDPHEVNAKNKDALFNRLTLGVFEPGSTFKLFTTAAAIEHGAKMDTTYDARTPVKIGRFSISDYHAERRILTLPEVFMHSSNIGSIKMAQAVGTDDFKNFLSDLGLMKAPQIEIPEVGAPLVPSPWHEVNTMTASFGHGIAVSPLQLVTASASIMNGGILVRPTLVMESGKDNAKSKSDVRVVSEKTAHRMRQLMRLVVTDGTARKADVPGYNVGGKTGTADKTSGKGYDRDKRRASFMAFFPAEAPRYAVYIMIDEPKGIKESYGYATAGWVAVPAVKNVIESMIAIEGLRPQENDELGGTLTAYVKTREQIAKERQVAAFSDH